MMRWFDKNCGVKRIYYECGASWMKGEDLEIKKMMREYVFKSMLKAIWKLGEPILSALLPGWRIKPFARASR